MREMNHVKFLCHFPFDISLRINFSSKIVHNVLIIMIAFLQGKNVDFIFIYYNGNYVEPNKFEVFHIDLKLHWKNHFDVLMMHRWKYSVFMTTFPRKQKTLCNSQLHSYVVCTCTLLHFMHENEDKWWINGDSIHILIIIFYKGMCAVCTVHKVEQFLSYFDRQCNHQVYNIDNF